MTDHPETIAGLGGVAGAYSLILCDVFGVLHDAARAFPAAGAALDAFRATGGTVVLVSNAAEPGPRLADTLLARGVLAAYDDLVTAADTARILLREQALERAHHIGPVHDRVLFEGLPIALTEIEAADVIVCTGYPDSDDSLDASLTRAHRRGLRLICTNPDTSLTAGTTRLRFAGLVAARYRKLGGAVVETGKPGWLIYRHALDRAERARGGPVDPGRVLASGDTPALDVAGALRAGFSALQIGHAPPQARPAGAPGRLYGMPALVW